MTENTPMDNETYYAKMLKMLKKQTRFVNREMWIKVTRNPRPTVDKDGFIFVGKQHAGRHAQVFIMRREGDSIAACED